MHRHAVQESKSSRMIDIVCFILVLYETGKLSYFCVCAVVDMATSHHVSRSSSIHWIPPSVHFSGSWVLFSFDGDTHIWVCVCVCVVCQMITVSSYLQANLVAAFEQSLALMTARLQSLSVTSEQKVHIKTHTFYILNTSCVVYMLSDAVMSLWYENR